MVCDRCITVIRHELLQLDIIPLHIRLGEVELTHPLTDTQATRLRTRLAVLGFELLDDQKQQLVAEMIDIITAALQQDQWDEQPNFSVILSQRLLKDYSLLSKLFSEQQSITIEKFILQQKMARIKELLAGHHLSLNQIAHQLGYSSVSHLSAQFKKATGLTPTHFRQLIANKPDPLI
jgi:AraC family transcriptional regulator